MRICNYISQTSHAMATGKRRKRRRTSNKFVAWGLAEFDRLRKYVEISRWHQIRFLSLLLVSLDGIQGNEGHTRDISAHVRLGVLCGCNPFRRRMR